MELTKKPLSFESSMDYNERRQEKERGQEDSLHSRSGGVFHGTGGKDHKTIKVQQEHASRRE